jgi:hypothetical protein
MTKAIILFLAILALGGSSYFVVNKKSETTKYKIGEPIDSLNGVYIYYNGTVDNVSGRNITKDNYNLGLKYQCVEFIKRYYYQYMKHKMPNTYGHAKEYFDASLGDGVKNEARNLIQYKNGSKSKPKVSDILVLSATIFNSYGHVSIISKVTDDEVEVIQQNPGLLSDSRETYTLSFSQNKWTIENKRIFGWLRKE